VTRNPNESRKRRMANEIESTERSDDILHHHPRLQRMKVPTRRTTIEKGIGVKHGANDMEGVVVKGMIKSVVVLDLETTEENHQNVDMTMKHPKMIRVRIRKEEAVIGKKKVLVEVDVTRNTTTLHPRLDAQEKRNPLRGERIANLLGYNTLVQPGGRF
jgi:hypothetical protein